MTGEFLQPRPTIETISNPFRPERGQQVIFRETQRQFQSAGKIVQEYWDSLLHFGIITAFQQTEVTPRPVIFDSKDINGQRVSYMVKSKGLTLDTLNLQPIKVFKFTKLESDQSDQPDSMVIGASKEWKLVSLTAESIEGDLPQHYFHFMGDELTLLDQVGTPQTLFPAQDTSKMQFARIYQGPSISSASLLTAEFGILGDSDANHHTYEYIGDDLALSQRLRVTDVLNCEMELVGITQEGIVENQKFSLPQAVANIANFQPATAA